MVFSIITLFYYIQYFGVDLYDIVNISVNWWLNVLTLFDIIVLVNNADDLYHHTEDYYFLRE